MGVKGGETGAAAAHGAVGSFCFEGEAVACSRMLQFASAGRGAEVPESELRPQEAAPAGCKGFGVSERGGIAVVVAGELLYAGGLGEEEEADKAVGQGEA